MKANGKKTSAEALKSLTKSLYRKSALVLSAGIFALSFSPGTVFADEPSATDKSKEQAAPESKGTKEPSTGESSAKTGEAAATPPAPQEKPDLSGQVQKTPPQSGSVGSLTASKAIEVIQKGEDFGEGFSLNVSFDRNKKDSTKSDVVIQTWQNLKSQDLEHDSKIDAVLMSKKLIDAFPDSLETLGCFRIRYFSRADKKSYFEITVYPDIVKAFGSGALTEQSLIGTLPLERVSGTTPAVAPTQPVAATQTTPKPVGPPLDGMKIERVLEGYRAIDRAKLLDRVKAAEKIMGRKATAVRGIVGAMETSVRDGDNTSAQNYFSTLFKAVGELEKDVYSKRAPVEPVTGGGGKKPSGTDPLLALLAERKQQAGVFFPKNGPMYPDRRALSEAILTMQKSGMDVKPFQKDFVNMEALAAAGNPGVEIAVKSLNKKLGLKDLKQDSEYLSEQKLSDELKKRGQE